MPHEPGTLENSTGPKYYGKFDADGRTILTDYDTSRTFASFLPGIGGEYGTPMWAFFVNRGQVNAMVR